MATWSVSSKTVLDIPISEDCKKLINCSSCSQLSVLVECMAEPRRPHTEPSRKYKKNFYIGNAQERAANGPHPPTHILTQRSETPDDGFSLEENTDAKNSHSPDKITERGITKPHRHVRSAGVGSKARRYLTQSDTQTLSSLHTDFVSHQSDEGGHQRPKSAFQFSTSSSPSDSRSQLRYMGFIPVRYRPIWTGRQHLNKSTVPLKCDGTDLGPDVWQDIKLNTELKHEPRKDTPDRLSGPKCLGHQVPLSCLHDGLLVMRDTPHKGVPHIIFHEDYSLNTARTNRSPAGKKCADKVNQPHSLSKIPNSLFQTLQRKESFVKAKTQETQTDSISCLLPTDHSENLESDVSDDSESNSSLTRSICSSLSVKESQRTSDDCENDQMHEDQAHLCPTGDEHKQQSPDRPPDIGEEQYEQPEPFKEETCSESEQENEVVAYQSMRVLRRRQQLEKLVQPQTSLGFTELKRRQIQGNCLGVLSEPEEEINADTGLLVASDISLLNSKKNTDVRTTCTQPCSLERSVDLYSRVRHDTPLRLRDAPSRRPSSCPVPSEHARRYVFLLSTSSRAIKSVSPRHCQRDSRSDLLKSVCDSSRSSSVSRFIRVEKIKSRFGAGKSDIRGSGNIFFTIWKCGFYFLLFFLLVSCTSLSAFTTVHYLTSQR